MRIWLLNLKLLDDNRILGFNKELGYARYWAKENKHHKGFWMFQSEPTLSRIEDYIKHLQYFLYIESIDRGFHFHNEGTNIKNLPKIIIPERQVLNEIADLASRLEQDNKELELRYLSKIFSDNVKGINHKIKILNEEPILNPIFTIERKAI